MSIDRERYISILKERKYGKDPLKKRIAVANDKLGSLKIKVEMNTFKNVEREEEKEVKTDFFKDFLSRL